MKNFLFLEWISGGCRSLFHQYASSESLISLNSSQTHNNTTHMNTTNHHCNSQRKNHQDHILRPEYQRLRLRFPSGSTWLRILSPCDSGDAWRLLFLAHEFPGGQFVHPSTFHPDERSAFDIAHHWFRRFRPAMLRSRSNKRGYRLRPITLCAFWAIEYSETDNHSLKLVVESFRDGIAGPIGLAHEIQHKITETDENNRSMCDAIHPENGVMICVERCKRQFSRAPLDWVRVGRVPRSIGQLFQNICHEEMIALRPLEQVLQKPTVEEEWKYLGRLITPRLADEIRTFALRCRV
jgi:hypothetical protein